MSAQLAQSLKSAIAELDWLPTSDATQAIWERQQKTLGELRKELAAFEAAPQQEPVAWLWKNSATGRTRIVTKGTVITADASWEVVGPLVLGGAAPQQAQAPGWQDIATAPKDGRTVQLGYFNSHGKWRSLRGQWMSADYIAEFWEDPDDGEPGWYETSVENDDVPNCWRTKPTHWMPLPAAPQQGSKS